MESAETGFKHFNKITLESKDSNTAEVSFYAQLSWTNDKYQSTRP